MIDSDYFYHYGEVDQRSEMEADLVQGLVQPPRSMFYYRSYGAGVPGYENAPVSLSTEVALKYSVASWVARRNLEVSDGSGGTRDRRAITSQSAVSVRSDGDSVTVEVLYVPYFDWKSPSTISLPVGY